MKYRPEIDGLRTIAVIPVILFHLQYSFIRGGFYGVDVFFVISGYLITSILNKKIYEGSFSLLDFWQRRVKRLLPLLLTVVLTTLVVTPIILFKPIVRALSGDALPAIFSYTNYNALYKLGDYWGWGSRDSFFLHTWSLSVEEQFYLIFPLFLLFSFRVLKNVLIPTIAFAICSFLFFSYLLFKDPDIAFFMLHARWWELSVGGILALTIHRFKNLQSNRKDLLSLLGLMSIILSYTYSFNDSNKIGFEVLFAVLGTALVILFSHSQGSTGRFLSNRPMVFIGKISYSLYLWHWPVIVVFNNLEYYFIGFNKHLLSGMVLTITFILSMISFYLIENKTRYNAHTLKIVACLFLAIISIYVFYNSANFNIYYKSSYNQITSYLKFFDISPSPAELKSKSIVTQNVIMPDRQREHSKAFKEGGIATLVNEKFPEIVVVGDSHGVMWAKVIDEVCADMEFSRTFYTSNAVSPFVNIKNIENQQANECFTKEERTAYAKSIINNFTKWLPKILIISCRWDLFFRSGKSNYKDLTDFIEFAKSKNIAVIIINQPPALHFVKNNNACQFITYLKIAPNEGFNYVSTYNTRDIENSNSAIDSISDLYQLDRIDVYSKFVIGEKSRISYKKDFFYFDDDHLSYEGALFCKGEIKDVIQETIKRRKQK